MPDFDEPGTFAGSASNPFNLKPTSRLSRVLHVPEDFSSGDDLSPNRREVASPPKSQSPSILLPMPDFDEPGTFAGSASNPFNLKPTSRLSRVLHVREVASPLKSQSPSILLPMPDFDEPGTFAGSATNPLSTSRLSRRGQLQQSTLKQQPSGKTSAKISFDSPRSFDHFNHPALSSQSLRAQERQRAANMVSIGAEPMDDSQEP
jgi:hypothetical protein